VTINLQLDHVSLFVRDRDTSSRFYGEVLGLAATAFGQVYF